MDKLLEHDAQVLIHLGDVGSVEVIDALVTPRPGTVEPVESHLVFGNTDWDWLGLSRYANHVGVHVDHPVGRLQFGPDALIFLHGHVDEDMEQALAQHPRWICHGHSHRQVDVRRNGVRVINPGALFRAQTYTVAMLDTDSDEVIFYDVGTRANSL